MATTGSATADTTPPGDDGKSKRRFPFFQGLLPINRATVSVEVVAGITLAALGRAAFVTPDFVKPGATVIDVGTTRVEDRAFIEQLYPPGSKRHAAFEKRGALVLGDVHPAVEQVAGALTPVPGGVGPLTIAMLLKNTVRAAHERRRAR